MTRAKDSRGVRRLSLSLCTAFLCAVVLVVGTRPAQAGINIWTSHEPPGGDGWARAVYPIMPIVPIMPSMLNAATFADVCSGADFAEKSGLRAAHLQKSARFGAGVPPRRALLLVALDILGKASGAHAPARQGGSHDTFE